MGVGWRSHGVSSLLVVGGIYALMAPVDFEDLFAC